MRFIFKADALLHFGTHGSLEFMPGKQVGMSGAGEEAVLKRLHLLSVAKAYFFNFPLTEVHYVYLSYVIVACRP